MDGNSSTVEYWRSRALKAEARTEALQAALESSERLYIEYEQRAAAAFEAACRSYESRVIAQFGANASPISKRNSLTEAESTSSKQNRADRAVGTEGGDNSWGGGHPAPQTTSKPRRAPPVPPSNSFGAPGR